MFDTISYVLSKNFTSQTALGGGAVAGKNVIISSITPIEGGNRITFSYTLDDGTVKTSNLDVMDGIDGQDGTDGVGISKVEKIKTEGLVDTYKITFTDGASYEFQITNGADGYIPQKGVDYFDGEKGQDGISPTIVENAGNNADTYKLDITDANHTFTTPNLKGTGGGTGGGEENVQSDWNETDTTSDAYIKNKPTIPTVPTKVSELENDNNYISSIPDEYVTETELTAKGYLTEHQDLSEYAKTVDVVAKEDGKSLVSDTDIAQITTNKNAIATLNGTGEGSVDKKVADEIAKVVANAPEDFDTLKEVADWIANDTSGAAKMQNDLATLNGDSTKEGSVQYQIKDALTDYAKTADINTELDKKVNTTDIVDNLTSTDIDKPVSANQAKVLDSKITTLEGTVTDHTDNTDIHVTAEEKTAWNGNVDSNKISNSVVGTNNVYVKDSAKAPIIAFKGNGYTKQNTYTGKNLLNPTLATTTSNGITCTNNGDGTYTVNGTATANAMFCVQTVDSTNLIGKTYKLTGVKENSNVSLVTTDNKSSTSVVRITDEEGKIFEIKEWTSGVKNFGLYISVLKDSSVNNAVVKPMLTADLEATYDDFEPYVGGIPSPNPDYPQEIQAYGDMGWFDGKFVQGYSHNSTVGKPTTATTSNQYITSIKEMPCEPNDTIIVKYYTEIYAIYVLWLDENKNYLSNTVKGNTKMATVVAPENAKYFKIELGEENGILADGAGLHTTVLKNGMYCAPVKSVGKNILGGIALAESIVNSGNASVVLDKDNKTVSYNRAINEYILYDNFKDKTQYTFVFDGVSENKDNCTNLLIKYKEGGSSVLQIGTTTSVSGKSIQALKYIFHNGYVTTLNYEKCGIFEGVITADEFESYEESVSLIPTSQPFYDGDYIQLNADGTGVEHRENVLVNGGNLDWQYNTTASCFAPVKLTPSISPSPSWATTINVFCTNYKTVIGTPSDKQITAGWGSIYIKDDSFGTDTAAFKTAMNGVSLVYKLKTQTDTPLTSDQLSEIRKLMSFENQTTFTTDDYDAEFEVQYYKNTDNGKVVSAVESKVEEVNNKVDGVSGEVEQIKTTNLISMTIQKKAVSFLTAASESKVEFDTPSNYKSLLQSALILQISQTLTAGVFNYKLYGVNNNKITFSVSKDESNVGTVDIYLYCISN